MPIGNGTLPTLRSNAAGTVAWWYCPTESGKWQLNWAAATAASLSASNTFAEIYNVVTATDPIAAFHAATSKNVKLPMSDPSLTPVWCPFIRDMASGAPPAVSKPNSAASLTSNAKAGAGGVTLAH